MTRKTAKGANAVRAAIENAELVSPAPSVQARLKNYFKMREDGLHRIIDEELRWISARFSIDAETIDNEGCWGFLISWQDRDGVRREEIFSRDMFSGECTELRNRLAKGGLSMAADQKSRQAFAMYLNLIESPVRAKVVSRTGWHHIGLNRVFVLPGQVIGNNAQRVLLQTAARNQAAFASAGTLDEWKRSIAFFAYGNSRLLFAISCAFAGPLLEMVGDRGGGFNLGGKSSSGKSTALYLAASVWGGDVGDGSKAFACSWRTTDNGMEGIAAAHSDTLLCMDEVGQADGKWLGALTYTLSSGQGKIRGNRDGSARAAIRFRILFFSTGEIGLADKVAEDKKTVKAGQEVRWIEIAADAGAGWGIFEELHEEIEPAQLAELLLQGTRDCYGTAGPAFVQSIVNAMKANPDFPDKLAERLNIVVADWLKPYGETGGQVRSVARRFALVAVAGELASEAGITGWTAGEAEKAAAKLFYSWLSARGTVGAREDMQAIEQMGRFLSAHGNSRFEKWEKDKRPHNEGDIVPDVAPVERGPVINRAGWRQWTEEEENGKGYWRYFLTKVAMEEALAGLDFRASVRVLVKSGFVIPGKDGRSSESLRPPGSENSMRLYRVRSSAPGAGMDEAGE